MTDISKAGRFTLGDRQVMRMGYGAMQLTGPGAFGPPKDRTEALAVLREAVAAGVNHIDTADFYGPHVTNQLIREALHPYPDDLLIATKVGVFRGEGGSWMVHQSPADLRRGVEDNLRNLGVDVLDLVNLRVVDSMHGPTETSIEERFTAMAEMQQQGLIRHLGLSNVTATQVAEAQRIAPVVCVQNQYNLVHREDDALIDLLAQQEIAFVPFSIGGLKQILSDGLAQVAARLGASPLQVAQAWLLARAPNILIIPGTSSVAHLRENLAVAEMTLSDETVAELRDISGSPNE